MAPELSIVIITLNEGKYLAKLLESIKKQDYKKYEIIVSDGKSKDNTIDVAKKYKCKIVIGTGGPGPGRNAGAKIANGEYILFFDADVVLPINFLSELIEKVKRKNIGSAGCAFMPSDKGFLDIILFSFANIYNKFWSKIKPKAPGWCIITKNSIFKKAKGFDKDVFVAEDHDYVRRARKFGKFSYLSWPKIYVSPRRMHEEGLLKTIYRYIYCEVYLLFHKNVKKNIYQYKFGKHR